jgi:DNA-binding MarR family transcriptional regulator
MSEHHLPERLLALPMYLMLALTREGYRHAVRSKVHIRMPQYAVLAVLDQLGPSSQKAVAESIGFHKSDVTKIINDLESRTLVQRQEDAADSRRHRVTLTAKGKRQLEASDRELTASMKEFLRGLSEQEYSELQRLLLKAIWVHDARFRAVPGTRGP